MSTAPAGYVETAHAAEARALKAYAIATMLLRAGATADTVAHLTEPQRRTAERAAGTRRGSDATWRIVAEMVARSERERARCPFCGLGDPEGVVGPRQAVGHAGPCSK